jgi:hypothetical protein
LVRRAKVESGGFRDRGSSKNDGKLMLTCDTICGITQVRIGNLVQMNYKPLLEKWLSATPSDESVDTVKTVLKRVFGKDTVCKNTGDSHQMRVKHPALRDLPGFGPLGT